MSGVPRLVASLLLLVASLLGGVLVAGCAPPSAVDQAAHFVRMHREAEAKKVLRDRLAERPDDVGARRMLVRVLAWTDFGVDATRFRFG